MVELFIMAIWVVRIPREGYKIRQVFLLFLLPSCKQPKDQTWLVCLYRIEKNRPLFYVMRLRKGTVRVCLKLSCENIAISDLAFSTNTLNIVNCKDDNIRKLNRDTILKFLFSKTATKIDEIFSVDVKSTVKISSIFVAFLKNINFTQNKKS